METLTLSHPHSFLYRGMSSDFDGGVGGRYTNRVSPTPVVPRATFPTTFDHDGTSSRSAIYQDSRPDPNASVVSDPRLTSSQIAATGSRGRGEIAFYRPQHQPANVSSSVMLDTIEHQSLQSSPRGSPQALPIRSLAQVGPSGGLPSVRQVRIPHFFFFFGFGK
jgi:hypothetical protein